MSMRTIISIDEQKCNGCGLCIPNCPEGAMQVIDGKARLISDLFCDGLGACVGHCPEGAIALIQREAEPYDEARAMANIAPQGAGTIRAHLEHLAAHGEERYLAQALGWLGSAGIPVPPGFSPARPAAPVRPAAPGRPAGEAPTASPSDAAPSALTNWPIQLHLLSPMAPRFHGSEVVLAADCVAYAVGSFHSSYLRGKSLAIACPKLDDGQDVYREKITALIDHAQIASLTVMMMQVPCCRGLLALVQKAREQAHRDVPVKAVIVSIEDGSVLLEQAVPAQAR
ncbi:MAG TPA: 4Fe-4S binding protein [Spirochaetia bacterium]|nr:4Fe-4S binding protein [Spirochaetia bacterium]